MFPRAPIISTIHGVIHRLKGPDGLETLAPEHPALNARVGRFVGVSEEVRDVLKRDFGIEAVIVRNFFDLDHWRAVKAVSEKPKRFLFNSNYNDSTSAELEILRAVAKHYGAELVPIGLNHAWVVDTREKIENADVVVGIGRSVLEGVAMGRLGLVHGHWGTGGVIGPQTVESLRQCNFSGRNAQGRLMTPKEIVALIDRYYNPENLNWGIDYIRKEHNVLDAADRYLRLARELIARPNVYAGVPATNAGKHPATPSSPAYSRLSCSRGPPSTHSAHEAGPLRCGLSGRTTSPGEACRE